MCLLLFSESVIQTSSTTCWFLPKFMPSWPILCPHLVTRCSVIHLPADLPSDKLSVVLQTSRIPAVPSIWPPCLSATPLRALSSLPLPLRYWSSLTYVNETFLFDYGSLPSWPFWIQTGLAQACSVLGSETRTILPWNSSHSPHPSHQPARRLKDVWDHQCTPPIPISPFVFIPHNLLGQKLWASVSIPSCRTLLPVPSLMAKG